LTRDLTQPLQRLVQAGPPAPRCRDAFSLGKGCSDSSESLTHTAGHRFAAVCARTAYLFQYNLSALAGFTPGSHYPECFKKLHTACSGTEERDMKTRNLSNVKGRVCCVSQRGKHSCVRDLWTEDLDGHLRDQRKRWLQQHSIKAGGTENVNSAKLRSRSPLRHESRAQSWEETKQGCRSRPESQRPSPPAVPSQQVTTPRTPGAEQPWPCPWPRAGGSRAAQPQSWWAGGCRCGTPGLWALSWGSGGQNSHVICGFTGSANQALSNLQYKY